MNQTNKAPSVLHVWSMYLPTLFDRTHPYGLSLGDDRSTLVAGRFVDNGAPLHPHTFWMTRETPTQASDPSLLHRIRSRLLRPFYWPRLRRFLKTHFERVKPDLIHVHFGNTAASLLGFLRQIDIPK